MSINWKSRFKHKTFWVALASAVILLCQQLGLDVFPENAMEIVNTVLLICMILGVVVDTSTPGLSDSE